MFNFSFAELLTLGVVALIVLGPEKLPQTMRKLGTYYAKFRRTVNTLQAELESELDLAETRQKMQEELAKIKQAEADMQNEMAMMRRNMRQFEKQQDTELSQDMSVATPSKDTTSYDDANKRSTNEGSTSESSLKNNALETNKVDSNSATKDSIELEKSEQKDTDTHLTSLSMDTLPTRPWENMWFKLGEYDKKRRQPLPPYLPDYTCDPLLNDRDLHHQSSSHLQKSNAHNDSDPLAKDFLSAEDSLANTSLANNDTQVVKVPQLTKKSSGVS